MRKSTVILLLIMLWLSQLARAKEVSFCGFSIDYPESLIDSVYVGLGARGDTMLFLASNKAGFRHDELIINVSRSTADHCLSMAEWQRQIDAQLRKMDADLRKGDKRLRGGGLKHARRTYPNAYVTYVARLSTSPCYYYTELRVQNECLLTICVSAHHEEAYPQLLKIITTLRDRRR